MKLSKDQLQAIYENVREELNSQSNIYKRDVERGNKKREKEAVEKFKKTKEYEAIMTLAKAFPRSSVDWSKKHSVESLAFTMFKPERKNPYIHSYEACSAIALLSIDCKNLKELNEKVKSHFGLKKNIAIKPWAKIENQSQQ